MIRRPARAAVHRLLRGIEGGRLELVDGRGRSAFGDADAGLRAQVEVRDQRAYTWMLRGSTGLCEGYVRGLWDCDDLVALTRIACRSLAPLDRLRHLAHPLLGPAQRLFTLVPRNTRAGARRHIAAHYDLGNELFESFLDERMIYSCAYFAEEDATLEEAQLAKLERICRGLRLRPDDHLLEIGTGWGGLALHAAREYGCRVTTTTISREQFSRARDLVDDADLTDRITVLDRDYRDLDGSFDKLVSIEMIEAVGWQYFEEFFRRCGALLRPEGLMFLQAIVIDDRVYELEKASRSFSNRHIFPGGCLPSMELIGKLVARETDMSTIWLEDISPHYAETLRNWRLRFNESFQDLRPLGYDEDFRRLWSFYLAFSEGGFRERRIRDVQAVFAKPQWRGDDLLIATERDADALAAS